MEITTYYKELIAGNYEGISDDLYFDYQGEGYNKEQLTEVNPYLGVENLVIKRELKNDEFYYAHGTMEKDNKKIVFMDLILLEDGIIVDHYHVQNELIEKIQINGTTSVDDTINYEDTKASMLSYWNGTDLSYAKNYKEHSINKSEIYYDAIVQVKGINDLMVTVIDAKINGLHGTQMDLYRVKNEEFHEHWDVFTVDLVQPETYLGQGE